MAFKFNIKLSILIVIGTYFLFQGLPGLLETWGFTWQLNLWIAGVLIGGAMLLK